MEKHQDGSYARLEQWQLEEAAGGASDRGFIRVPARQALDVIMLSREVVGYRGHYGRNGCEPCIGPGCPYEARGMGSRARAVYSVSHADLGGRWLLDVGEGTFAQITGIAREAGSLRGLRLRLSKRGGVNNGQIDATWWNRLLYPDAEVLEAADVWSCLVEMWRIRHERGECLIPSREPLRV